MSLPQTLCSVPFAEQASAIVSPSLPFNESAFASHGVGLPGSLEAGALEGVDVDGEVSEWLPPPVFAALLSFLSFEQPAVPTTIAVTRSTTQRPIFDRSNFLVSYERITTLFPSFIRLISGGVWRRKYTSESIYAICVNCESF